MDVEVWIFICFSIVIAITALVLLVYYQRQLDAKEKELQDLEQELEEMRQELQQVRADREPKA